MWIVRRRVVLLSQVDRYWTSVWMGSCISSWPHCAPGRRTLPSERTSPDCFSPNDDIGCMSTIWRNCENIQTMGYIDTHPLSMEPQHVADKLGARSWLLTIRKRCPKLRLRFASSDHCFMSESKQLVSTIHTVSCAGYMSR